MDTLASPLELGGDLDNMKRIVVYNGLSNLNTEKFY